MKVSGSWLRDYVDHALSPNELADTLTSVGLEVEGVEEVEPELNGIVVGYVSKVRVHPRADRLVLCDVDLGHGSLTQIVCGAPNVKAGQYVPVATEGTVVAVGERQIRIKRAKLRGEWSAGMICAEDELGLSDDHTGIMVLETPARPGQPFSEYVRAAGHMDTVFDVAITPNRPDATCHIGVARDLSARLGIALRKPAVDVPAAGEEVARQIQVSIECPELCRRYVATMVENVRVAPSPVWLQRRLKAIGLRPINNVVDVTNFVLHECGQPLHAFDYDRLRGGRIIVRESRLDEPFTTLDGKEHVLPPGVAMICDAERSVAIGGIMGGENSEVRDATTTVLIESAWFDPTRTRRSARAIGAATDASYRFERGVDPHGQPWAAARAAALIARLAGGTVVAGIVDAHPAPLQQTTVSVRPARIASILGIEVPRQEVVRILTALDFGVRDESDRLECAVPSNRPDVRLEIDLIEEVARIYGFDNIVEPASTPLSGSAPTARPVDVLRDRAHLLLNGMGYREIYSNSLLPRKEAEAFRSVALDCAHPVVETLNAVSATMTTLRPSLLPGILRAMQHNVHHGQRALRFYEFGHVFHRADEEVSYVEGYAEHESLIMGLTGPAAPLNWDSASRLADFFDLKGDVEHLADALCLVDLRWEAHDAADALTALHATLSLDQVRIGTLARLSDAEQAAWDLPDPVYFAEFNWTRLTVVLGGNMEQAYQPVDRFPVVERDLAVVVPSSQPVGDMVDIARRAGTPLLREVTVFDVYQDVRLGHDRKSVGLALRFATDRTLLDAEVDKAVHEIVKALSELCSAVLRS